MACAVCLQEEEGSAAQQQAAAKAAQKRAKKARRKAAAIAVDNAEQAASSAEAALQLPAGRQDPKAVGLSAGECARHASAPSSEQPEPSPPQQPRLSVAAETVNPNAAPAGGAPGPSETLNPFDTGSAVPPEPAAPEWMLCPLSKARCYGLLIPILLSISAAGPSPTAATQIPGLVITAMAYPDKLGLHTVTKRRTPYPQHPGGHDDVQVVMRDPVLCTDGHTYERAAITAWLAERGTSPKTGLPVEDRNLLPNHSLRSIIGQLSGAN